MHEPIEPTLPGFETIKRFRDHSRNLTIAKILPGEFYVSTSHEFISTVLGSCVSACIWDSVNKVGGMNHFFIPQKTKRFNSSNSYALRYGNWIMESLINELLKHGACRERLQAKVFGGAQMNLQINDANRNVEFVLAHLALENIPLVAQDAGGTWPRKVMFEPLTGKVRMKHLQHTNNDTVQRREHQYFKDVQAYEFDSNIEIFSG